MQKNERAFNDSKLLRTFVEIADCQNLTLAASKLNRSQSAISVQIRNLESALGNTLFIREGTGMSLTKHGEKLLPVAKNVLRELGKVNSLFETVLKGRIRVGIPDDFDEGVLELTLADFAQTNPGVEVIARSGCTMGFPDAIKRGELDIAVYSAPDNKEGEFLLRQKPVWVCSKAINLASSEPVPIAVINHGCWLGELPKATLDQYGREYNIAFECSGVMSLKAAIRSGFAVGILFESIVEEGMKILSEKDGFPDLPESLRTIIVSSEAPKDLSIAMTKALKHAV